MTIYHKHHITPRHMGGTDDPENLVEVTIEQHAALHKQLWEDLGHWEDYLAWKSLSGQMLMSEVKIEAQKQGGRKGGLLGGKKGGLKCKEEKIGYLSFTREQNIKFGKKTVEMKKGIHSPEWNKSIGGKLGGQKCKENKIGFLADDFDKGKASRGKIWINKNNNEIKIFSYEYDEYKNEGWEKGRKSSFRKVKNNE